MLLLPLLLFRLSVPRPKLLPVDTLVPFLGAASAATIIVLPGHVVKDSATTVARRATLLETAENQPNQQINLPEQVSVRPAIIMVKLGTSRGTALSQHQLAIRGES